MISQQCPFPELFQARSVSAEALDGNNDTDPNSADEPNYATSPAKAKREKINARHYNRLELIGSCPSEQSRCCSDYTRQSKRFVA
jgi:hypothetical protein